MKIATIAIMKIRHEFFDLIVSGVKKYEVRDMPLEGIDIIVYRDAATGLYLGSYYVEGVIKFNRSEDELVRDLSSVDLDTFLELFPMPENGGPINLWAAKLSTQASLKDLFGSGNFS